MNNHQQFKEICAKHGWKCTAQRLAVYNFIAQNFKHPGVNEAWDDIKQKLPTVTRESVYRILNEFAEANLIHRLDHIDSARYDSQVGAHGHFICEVCGEISDFNWPQDASIPQELLSCNVSHMEIRIVGHCPKCKLATQTKS